MTKTLVVSGGNSGIGLELAQQLGKAGHRLILVARDPKKGEAAVAAVKAAGGSAEFIASDLSTHAGVRAACASILATAPKIDGLALAAGVFISKEQRTTDGLHPMFAVNYLSRYHMTQLLLPALRAAEKPRVILLVAGVPQKTKIDFAWFPKFGGFGFKALPQVQVCNYHFLSSLTKTEPILRTAVCNVGVVQTDIMREAPWLLRVLFSAFGQLIAIPVARSAQVAAHLCNTDDWPRGSYFLKPGHPERNEPLALDADATSRVMAASRELTGV